MLKLSLSRKTLGLQIILLVIIIISTENILQSNNNKLHLEGLYATSVNLNFEKYGPQNLFDRSDDYWMSMPGAGPDEGIMIYLAKKTVIPKIQLEMPESNNFSKIKKIQVVVDGTDIGTTSVYGNKATVNINKSISYIYIRITEVEGITSKQVHSDLRGFKKYERRYRTSKSIAISEIIFYGQNGTPLRINPPKIIKGTITPSSTLQPEEAYHKDYLFDSKKDSGWVEGSKQSGTGQTIEFNLRERVRIKKIKIWNGLQNSKKHYLANERIKIFSFGEKDEDLTKYTIRDSITPQVIKLSSSLRGRDFIFKIDQVYRGRSYKDCVISEIRFHDGESWFLVHTGYSEHLQRKKLQRIKNTVLANVVDKRINVYYEADYSWKNISLILRSNNSFVIWMENNDSDGMNEISSRKVLDGFWEIKKLSSSKAKIRILGRIFGVSKKYKPYVGNRRRERIAIFSDNLYIDKNSIRGSKQLKRITY